MSTADDAKVVRAVLLGGIWALFVAGAAAGAVMLALGAVAPSGSLPVFDVALFACVAGVRAVATGAVSIAAFALAASWVHRSARWTVLAVLLGLLFLPGLALVIILGERLSTAFG